MNPIETANGIARSIKGSSRIATPEVAAEESFVAIVEVIWPWLKSWPNKSWNSPCDACVLIYHTDELLWSNKTPRIAFSPQRERVAADVIGHAHRDIVTALCGKNRHPFNLVAWRRPEARPSVN